MIGLMAHRLALLLVALSIACAPAHGAALNLEMRHAWNGEGLLLDSLRYENAAGETLSVTRLSYLLSGFALEREDGVWMELPTSMPGSTPNAIAPPRAFQKSRRGSYRALRFQSASSPRRMPPIPPPGAPDTR